MNLSKIFKKDPWYKRTWSWIKDQKSVIGWVAGGLFAVTGIIGGLIWYRGR